MHYLKLSFAIFVAFLSMQTVGFAEKEPTLAEPIILEQPVETLKESIKLQVAKPAHRYSTAVMSRPFTMPTNSFETTLKLKTGAHGEKDSAFYSLNNLSLKYGVTNDFEMELGWNGMRADSMALHNFKADPSVSLSLNYFLFAVPHVAAMASLSTPFHFDNEVVKTTSFAMPTAFTVIKNKVGFLAFYHDTVVIHWRDSANKKQYTVDFNFPLKLSYQATDNFIAGISTEFGSLSTDGKHSHIGQTTPLHLSATYAITRAFDVVAQTGFDNVQDWRNSFSFIAGVTYRFGDIDG